MHLTFIKQVAAKIKIKMKIMHLQLYSFVMYSFIQKSNRGQKPRQQQIKVAIALFSKLSHFNDICPLKTSLQCAVLLYFGNIYFRNE